MRMREHEVERLDKIFYKGGKEKEKAWWKGM